MALNVNLENTCKGQKVFSMERWYIFLAKEKFMAVRNEKYYIFWRTMKKRLEKKHLKSKIVNQKELRPSYQIFSMNSEGYCSWKEWFRVYMTR